MTVIGLDLSLTATGIATLTETAVLKPGKLTGLDRLRRITDDVDFWCCNQSGGRLSTIAVEGPAYGSTGQFQHERGGLWWHVVNALEMNGFYLIVVPPPVLKKVATGKGTASKDDMVRAACRRFPWFDGDNNQADALFLACIAAELTGDPVGLPAANVKDLASKVTWIRP